MHCIFTFLTPAALFILKLLFLVLLQATLQELPFSGQVVSVTDGDTVKVFHDGLPETIRLSGIDCPEKRQAFGANAKDFTATFCFGKMVNVIPKTRDRYGRTVAELTLDDGRDLNHELVRNGYAWWSKKYAQDDEVLEELEVSARNGHSGLWADPAPIAPWDFRHKSKKQHQLPSR